MKPSFNKSYVVFSHVWTDGFGSYQDTNQLNICVLNMFSKLFKTINRERTGHKFTQHELFWIDTLALPVGTLYQKERSKAIEQMHHIYTHAKYTIVLDKSLMCIGNGPGYSGPAMKLTISKWMTRMWTLQEAVLSKEIYFYFRDQIYSMDRLESLFEEEDDVLHTCIPRLSRLYYDNILGGHRGTVQAQFKQKEVWRPKSKFVANVWKAAQWRSTEWIHQETLALAVLFNVQIDRFAQPNDYERGTLAYKKDCDDRMRHFLNLLSEVSPCPIPPGMIFLPGPRLQGKGYGWAPRSWLSSHKIESPDPLEPKANDPIRKEEARLNPGEGLEVHFPGFLLHDLGGVQKQLRKRFDFDFPAGASLLEWYHVELADRCRGDGDHFPDEEKLRGRDLAIIAARLPPLDFQEIALLVAIERLRGSIKYVEITNRIWLSRKGGQDKVKQLSDGFRTHDIEAMFAGERLPEKQAWCVDAPDDIEPSPQSSNGEMIGSVRSPTKTSQEKPLPLPPPSPSKCEDNGPSNMPKRRWTNYFRKASTAIENQEVVHPALTLASGSMNLGFGGPIIPPRTRRTWEK